MKPGGNEDKRERHSSSSPVSTVRKSMKNVEKFDTGNSTI